MSLIHEKIPLIMASIGSISKNRTNPQQGYRFRGIDDIYLAAQDVLSSNGVFCTPEIMDITREERTSQKGATLIYTLATIRYTFYASDGSSVIVKTIGEAMDSSDKGCNKAFSAAYKIAFLQVFCIPTEEIKDTEHETHSILPKKITAPVCASEPEPLTLEKFFFEIEKSTTLEQLAFFYNSNYKTAQKNWPKDDFSAVIEAKNKKKVELERAKNEQNK